MHAASMQVKSKRASEDTRTYLPVINGGRVGMCGLVKDLCTDTPSSKVATGVKHAPPHVVLTRRQRSRRRHWRRRCPWTRWH